MVAALFNFGIVMSKEKLIDKITELLKTDNDLRFLVALKR